jgi:AraC-like DNA-binding protein
MIRIKASDGYLSSNYVRDEFRDDVNDAMAQLASFCRVHLSRLDYSRGRADCGRTSGRGCVELHSKGLPNGPVVGVADVQLFQVPG